MINVILLILGLCVLGLLVMIVYAALKPTDATRWWWRKTPLQLDHLDNDTAVLHFEVPLRNKSQESAAITGQLLSGPTCLRNSSRMPGRKAMWKKATGAGMTIISKPWC